MGFFLKPKFMFLPPFLFYIPLNIKFDYKTTIKKIYLKFTIFSLFFHIML